MFERYTQSARRVIFHARAEAMQYGSPCIESEHLLLGVFRENEALATVNVASAHHMSVGMKR
jgi:ATP-dependent Clp protease ATP-binding subunit ClpC